MVSSDLIRVKKPTKELLERLKLIEDETFDSVINRILQTNFEEMMELNEQTHSDLNKRMEKIKTGDVFPSKDLLKKIKEKRAGGVKEIDDLRSGLC